MSSAADIQLTGSDYLTNLSFSGGMLHATNTINDPNVTLLYNTNNSVPIDTSRFRYLTYWLQVDGPYDLGEGSVARVVWNSQSLMSGTTATVSQDIIVWPGMNSYTIDLATLSAAADGGLEPVGAAEPWTAGVKRHLRLDPHEFPQARSFHIDDVKLTAKPAAGSHLHDHVPLERCRRRCGNGFAVLRRRHESGEWQDADRVRRPEERRPVRLEHGRCAAGRVFHLRGSHRRPPVARPVL